MSDKRHRRDKWHGFASAGLSLVLGLLLMGGTALAHDMNMHDMHGTSPADEAQMQKLHAMMPTFAVASANLDRALAKGDRTAAASAGKTIIAAIPDLKKSTPHKNANQRQEFVALATNLEKTVGTTVGLAKKGDFSGAKAAFKKVEATCAACHAKFRN